MRYWSRFFILVVLTAFFMACAAQKTAATKTDSTEDQLETQLLVEKSLSTFNAFMADPNMGAMRDLLKDAKGVFIIPQQIKGAFILGASGGSGVLVQRFGKGNEWTGPVFYTAGGVSFGLQAGGQAAEIVLIIMSDRGIAAFMSNNFKLGVDAGIAVGPMGVGAAASTANLSADILSFARAKGLYGGVSLDGAVVTPRDKWNQAYYGKPVKPPEVLVKGLKAPKAAELLNTVAAAASGTAKKK